MSKPLHDLLPAIAYKTTDYTIVNTPSHIVMRLLNDFPASVWTNKDLKWLCAISKNGAFEVELFQKLMRGLREAIPDENERRDHIVRNMIWSFCPSEGALLMTKRWFLGGAYRVIAGGFRAITEHNVEQQDFLKVKVELNKATGEMEIMTTQRNGEKKFVKFDCIVGNPPYQQPQGDTSDKAFYPPFVMKAMEAKPKFLSMVIPAKWMSGDGKGTEEFLAKMIECGKIAKITTEKTSKNWFPDVEIKGGVMYFLYDGEKQGNITLINGVDTDLSDAEVIITDAIAISIASKILVKQAMDDMPFFDTIVYGQNPYGINTNHNEWSDSDDAYLCHCSGGTGSGNIIKRIDRSVVKKNTASISQWKLCIANASGKGADGTDTTFIAKPNSIITQSYMVIGLFDTEQEAKNADGFLNTKFAQFMVSALKGTYHMPKRVFKWLPFLDFSRSYTDQDLYTMFNLSAEEIAHIETTTKDFPIYRKAKKTKIAKSA